MMVDYRRLYLWGHFTIFKDAINKNDDEALAMLQLDFSEGDIFAAYKDLENTLTEDEKEKMLKKWNRTTLFELRSIEQVYKDFMNRDDHVDK